MGEVRIIIARLAAVADRLDGAFRQFDAQADAAGLPRTPPIKPEAQEDEGA